jgi:Bacterial extracellular solute-binding proteins, family 5 Middle
VSIFDDLNVRTALTEAFDRCAALRTVLRIRDCADPTFRTDELTAPPASDYDPTVTLPAYNPTAAAALLDHAGYRVVGGVRRYKDGTTPLDLTVSLSRAALPYAGFAQRLQQDYARNLHIAVHILNPPGQLFGEGSPSVTGAFDIGLWADAWTPDPVGHIARVWLDQREHSQRAECLWSGGKFPGADRSLGPHAGSAGVADARRRQPGASVPGAAAPRRPANRLRAVAHPGRHRAGAADAVQRQEVASTWRESVEYGGLVCRVVLPVVGRAVASARRLLHAGREGSGTGNSA